MTQRDSPTIRRRQLGSELRRLREVSGLTGPQVAGLMEWDPGKVYRLEGGKQGIKPKELRELLGHLGVSKPEQVDEYVAMARAGKQPGWWSTYGPLPKTYETYIGIETSAIEIRTWEPILINGLLQTPRYAEAMIRGTMPELSDGQVEKQVTLRVARQERLSATRMWVILDQAVLYRQVGDLPTMSEQYESLLQASRRPELSLQVMPSSEGAHPGTRGQFTLLTFEDGQSVYSETPAGEVYPEGKYALACERAFEQLVARALSPNQSRTLISEVASQSQSRWPGAS